MTEYRPGVLLWLPLEGPPRAQVVASHAGEACEAADWASTQSAALIRALDAAIEATQDICNQLSPGDFLGFGKAA